MSGFHYPAVKFFDHDEAHPQGYLLLRCFETGHDTGVCLVHSLDDQINYIRKRIPSAHHYFPGVPGEVRYSNLADEKPFPLASFFARVIDHFELNDDSWITYTVAYNGGTHKQLLEKFSSLKKAIPESFIWHYIEQCIRAFAYLHYGIIDGKKRVEGEDWVPIVHRDGHEDNIIFHFPDPEYLSGLSDEARKRAEAFPRVILVDMGLANRVNDPVECRNHGRFEIPGGYQWEDTIPFRERIRELLETSFVNSPSLDDPRLEALYSEELIAVAKRFEGPPGVIWDLTTAHHLPSWDWVLSNLMVTAVRKKRQYIRQGDLQSLMWAMPKPPTNMPYHVKPGDRDGLRAVRKQGDYGEAVDFLFNTSHVTDTDELPACLDPRYDLSSPPRVPSPSDFFDTVEDAAKRLKRATDLRLQLLSSFGNIEGRLRYDINTIRGVVPILDRVCAIPDYLDSAASSSDTESDHSDQNLTRSNESESPEVASPASPEPAGEAITLFTQKRKGSHSTDSGRRGKR
ncbi:hypothetical protein MMC26_000454 [Xylographa opegraphella]|nr:hypothetical protein [Xylographa opegraphella]